jgi:serine/threonine-protein kinase ULK/ATG1
LDELFGNPSECCKRYQTAQILLHSLYQQVDSDNEKQLLLKCKILHFIFFTNYELCSNKNIFPFCNLDKDAVEKRLFVLQQQGYVTASFDENFTENIPS